MGEAIGEVAVIREDEQALRIGIEPPYRKHARFGRYQVGNDLPPLRVACRADYPARLEQQVIRQPGTGRKRQAVDRDPRRLRVYLLPDTRRLAVDSDPPRSDQILGAPTGGVTRAGYQLVEPFDGSSPRKGRSRVSTTEAGGM